ncbi:hypothetical protein [Saccharicrinis sp. FJH54]|uniref:hypothetical protein n=1 Tax=Saccharicrinis sp. FJH54 TaxID=3344665 RepID=UPI0035D48B47
MYSCATLLNSRETNIEIHTSPQSAKICLNNDTCVDSPVILEVPRGPNDFYVAIKNDTTYKNVRIKSRLSPEFTFGNLFFVLYSPLGYVGDAYYRDAMYTYHNSIYIDLNNSLSEYKKWKPSKKGQIYFRSSLPWFDNIGIKNPVKYETYNIYKGLALGADYYHSKRSFISWNIGVTGFDDIPQIYMDRWDLGDTITNFLSMSTKLTNNYDFNITTSKNFGFSVGYGLSLSYFQYKEHILNQLERHFNLTQNNHYYTLGLCFEANLFLLKYFYIGASYLPSFFTFKKNAWEYSHLAYVDFGIRLPLKKYRKDNITKINYRPKTIE